MRRVHAWMTVSVVGLLLVTAGAWADSAAAEKACEEGKTLLAKGDFGGAMDAFKAAAKADPDNRDYFFECALLQRVMTLREQMKSEQDSEIWVKMAAGLYNYYRRYHVNEEAAHLAGAWHARTGCGESAANLADVQLLMGKEAEAAELLGSLSEDRRTPRGELLHGVALARLGKLEAAKAQAAAFEMPKKDCDPQVCVAAARLYALVGEREKALEALKCGFESTPAALLDGVRADVKTCADFTELAAGEDFAAVMKTESKVKAGCGGCAGSKGCAKSCSKSKDAKGCAGDKEKKGEGCTGHDHDKE